MTIVLDENKWACKMIDEKSLGNKPSETLRRVARYYFDNGHTEPQVEELLEGFILDCNPSASIPKWSKSIKYAISKASKAKAINISGIRISCDTLNIIKGLDGIQTQRLMFTLLCLSEFWNTVNETDTGWVNTKDSDIMRMANINTSIKRQSALFASLRDAGYIQFSKKIDNTNVRVVIPNEGEPSLTITDFRNLGYQYLKWLGQPYMECTCCGITTKVTGKNQKYCRECAIKTAIQQRVNSVITHRQKVLQN